MPKWLAGLRVDRLKRIRVISKENQPAVSVNGCCPGQFFKEGHGRKKFSAGTIQKVDKPVAICLHQQFVLLALINSINEHRRLGRVVVKQIMWSELKIPFQFPAIWIERQHAIRIEIVSRPHGAIEIRRWIAGGPKQRIQLGIIGSRHPGRAATVQIAVTWPTFSSKLAWCWDRPETPGEFAGCGIVSRYESPNAVISP